jgi:hypothetical protein
MTKDELITKQQLQIEGLNDLVDTYEKATNSVWGRLHYVGGPLNGNSLGFTTEQVAFFSLIEADLETIPGTSGPNPGPSEEVPLVLEKTAAYRLGFLRAADWARRDDLRADVGSPAYLREMAADLSGTSGPNC